MLEKARQLCRVLSGNVNQISVRTLLGKSYLPGLRFRLVRSARAASAKYVYLTNVSVAACDIHDAADRK